MVNIKKKRKLKLTVLVIFGIFIINYELYPLVSSNSHYTLSLEKGSQIYEVIYYDEEAWKDTINVTSNPTDWFGGESDMIGAKSKATVLGAYEGGSITYNHISKLFFSWFKINTSFLEQYGFGSYYFYDNYPYEYNWGWYPQLAFWPFGTEPFDNYSNYIRPSFSYSYFLFREPLEYQNILDDYNNFAAVVNNDSAMQAINFFMPILNGDDFLWHFILDRYVMVTPINNYLTELINALECVNVSIQENKITFMRFGEKPYIMEFSYNSRGSLDNVIVKNSDDNLIYKITSSNLKFVVYIIIGISLGAIIGLIGFSFYRKRRLTLLLKSNLKNV
ncbi:hypothetical protein LCGC14_2186550 [marine sediment metagenome]|uniref:Uncharacterized protein n=1 Tax=marine sediment metagenome TaxID=412755 RepID=A0A0F9DL08_9ZZZZ